jgi:hypothetical protein
VTVTAPEATARAEVGRPGVTLRGVALAVAMVVLMVGMTQAMTIRAWAADVGGSSPPVAPTYLLFLWAVIVSAGPAALRRRLRLSRQDVLLGYCAGMISGPIAHEYAIGFLIPHMVAPYYFSGDWRTFHPWLPAWLGPRDPAVVRAFFLGSGGRVPWGAWLVPGLAWMSLLAGLLLTGHCAMILVRRQWIDHERLAFPLAQIPLGLSAAGRDGWVPALRAPLFWWGLALPMLLGAIHNLHRYAPSFPDLQLRPLLEYEFAGKVTPPWTGLGTLELRLVPWLVAIVALLPAEISFSGWFFFWVTKLEDVSALYFGATDLPDVYSNQYPALYSQGAGAAYAMAVLALIGPVRSALRARRMGKASPRRHGEHGGPRRSAKDSLPPSSVVLRVLFSVSQCLRGERALSPPYSLPMDRVDRPGADADDDEFASTRFALAGLLFGVALMVGWLWLAGMRLWVAALLVVLLLGYFVVFARIRGEAGLGMGVILWPKMLDEVMLTLVGSRALLPADLTVLYSVRWLYFGASTGGVVACQLESFKIAGEAGLRSRAAGGVLLMAALLAVPLAFVWTLHTYHAKGFLAMPIGHRDLSMVGSQIYWSYANLADALKNPKPMEWHGIGAMGAGAAVVLALSGLRRRFLWWPLHPVGYMAANSWGMHWNWGSFTLGWLIKVLLLRYGGLRVFRAAVPFFIGLVVGDMLSEGIWGAFAAWVALAL